MSNAASSLQSTESSYVPIFINDELVMLDQSTLNALKAEAYERGCTVEQVIHDAFTETLADPVRLARIISRAQAEEAALAH